MVMYEVVTVISATLAAGCIGALVGVYMEAKLSVLSDRISMEGAATNNNGAGVKSWEQQQRRTVQ